MSWVTPKTDWDNVTDKFNISDYNRIKGNLEFLANKASDLYAKINIDDMGVEKTYNDYIYASDFNKIEENLEKINQSIFSQDIGDQQEFSPNGIFVKYDELNRIESAMVRINNLLDRQKYGLRRLSFRLGNMKGVRI